MSVGDKGAVEARVFLGCLLPLVEVVVDRRPVWRDRLAGVRAVVGVGVARSDTGVRVVIDRGAIRVEQGVHPAADVTLSFGSAAALSAFFAGGRSLPRIRGAARHPRVCALFLWLVSQLRILSPRARRQRPGDRALYVELALYFITDALATMNRAGHPDMVALTEDSPERVYQWRVEGADIAAYLRMHDGRAWSGRGVYGLRRPFVQYTFPSVDAAFRVLTTTGSQMDSVIRGDVRPEGSPEYSRKISIVMQRAEALMTGG